jgi:hypothetical protein
VPEIPLTSGFYRSTPTAHGRRAEALLEQALSDVRGSIDAIPAVSEALANLRAETGELSPDDATDLLDDPFTEGS